MPFSPNFALCSKNYPRNINYMSAVIFCASLDFEKNCYSRTASYAGKGGKQTSIIYIFSNNGLLKNTLSIL